MNHSPPQILKPSKTRQSGFTLTELLIVIAIIAVLASLATTAAINAMNTAKRNRIALEIKEIERSLLTFKEEFQAFPPNAMTYPGNTVALKDVERMFKKMFPRHQEPAALIRALAGSDETSNDVTPQLQGGINGAESLYFWLGGFSKDEQYPISGTGGPSFDPNSATGEIIEDRNRIYEFDLTRLVPRNTSGGFDDSANAGRFITYEDPRTGNVRRINLWQYGPTNSTQPYVYFDTSRHKPAEYDPDCSGTLKQIGLHAIKRYREGFDPSNNPTPADYEYVNRGKLQLIHPGLDDIWGDQFRLMQLEIDGRRPLLFPTGPFTGDIADTLTNFTQGTLEAEQE